MICVCISLQPVQLKLLFLYDKAIDKQNIMQSQKWKKHLHKTKPSLYIMVMAVYFLGWFWITASKHHADFPHLATSSDLRNNFAKGCAIL